MKKMKKLLAWLLAGVICCSASVGATVAYLTDRDSEANVFTVGDVRIDLTEDFEQGAWLVPGVDIEKKPIIKNTGLSEAYVWATVAIPAVLDDVNDASKNVVHFNFDKDHAENGKEWTWKTEDGSAWNVKTVSHNNVDYNVYTILHQTPLKPGQETTSVFHNVYMDTHIDIAPDGGWYWIENGTPVNKDPFWNTKNGYPIMYVSAYGIQEAGFDNVFDAYDAYTAQWADGVEWGTVPVVITKGSELNGYLAPNKGGTFILGNDITTTGPINATAKAVIWLNGFTITNNGNDKNVTILNGNNTTPNELVINGRGMLTTVNGAINSGVVNQDGCVMTMNYVDIDTTNGSEQNSAIRNKGIATINGGKFNSDESIFISQNTGSVLTVSEAEVDVEGATVFYAFGNAQIVINSGTYKTTGKVFHAYNGGTIVVNGGIFSEDPTTYTGVTVNGTVTNNGDGTWTVA